MREAASPLGSERVSETSFRLLVESVLDYAIFLLDPDGYVVTWNKGAQRIKGYSADDIIGKHFSTFYTDADIKRNHPAWELQQARRNGVYEEEGWRLRKDGTRFWANVVITAVHDPAGNLIGYGKVTRDLTERKLKEERERELRAEQNARAQAEAANRAKSEFLTTMSHELRTPLNAIIGYTELLALGVQGPLTEDQSQSLERIRSSSKHLLGLINDVLNIARAESGHLEYAIKDVSAEELTSVVGPLVEPQFHAHGIAYERQACPPELYVRCDPDRTQQILLNLLTNAYKFTPPGGRVRLVCTVSGNDVLIAVQDNGRGIPADKLATVFDPFVQIDRHLNLESQQGVGLGLAISHDLADAMNGDLTVQSEVGKGSTFTLSLPRGTAPRQ
jgi:PAS domain S-box-containing protein